MRNFNYGDFFNLLYNMKKSKSLTELADKIYLSIPQTYKKVKAYEEKLNIKFYSKNKDNILNKNGDRLLLEMTAHLESLENLLFSKNKEIAIDENLIEDQIVNDDEYNVSYLNSEIIFKQFNEGFYDEIIVSSEYEKDIKFSSKKFVIKKPTYLIRSKDCQNACVFGNALGGPINRVLEREGIEVTEYYSEYTSISYLIKNGKGKAYSLLGNQEDFLDLSIKKCDELEIEFYLYKK